MKQNNKKADLEMKRILSIMLCATMLLCVAVGCDSKEENEDTEGVVSGEIILELYPEIAPITVENFVKLVRDGFYDGLTFHRIVSGFMIQGGDPNGDGSGGSSEKIKGEFSENGVENTLSHERGVISMARSNDMDSASSQFFICHADATTLDGKYAAFGKVIEGMDVVDKLAAVEVSLNAYGTEKSVPVVKQYIKSMEVLDDGDEADNTVKIKMTVGK